jgi:hypothetical protein
MALVLAALAVTAAAQDIEVVDELEISEQLGGFTGDLDTLDRFGYAISSADLDGDGRSEIFVGAQHDDDGGQSTGAVWILYLNGDGTVASHQKISATSGNLSGYGALDRFGIGVSAIGDLDGDGVPDLAVGAPGDGNGSVAILFLNADGTIKSQQKISRNQGGFPLDFGAYLEGGFLGNQFGYSVAAIGDVNGDGVVDLVVGMPSIVVQSFAQHPQDYSGAAWIVMLNRDGTVLDAVLLMNGRNGIPVDEIEDHIRWGNTVSAIGDVDGDGIPDAAISTELVDDGATGDCTINDINICNTGGIWILFLNKDGTVRDLQKISATFGGFPFPLEDGDTLGSALTGPGDLDADGIPDLVAGAPGDDDGCNLCGAVYVLYLNRDGTVKDGRKISMLSGGLQGPLETGGIFGTGVGSLEDLQGDGVRELIVGAVFDDSGQLDAGSIRLLFLDSDVARYGCASPSGSLVIEDGGPILGGDVTFGVHNPFSSQAAGSFSFVFGSTAPAFSLFPCGLPLPGFGMDPAHGIGELLIDPFLPNPVLILFGAPLASPQDTSEVLLQFPIDPALDGMELYFQGVLVDLSSGATVRRGLTEGLRLRLHP